MQSCINDSYSNVVLINQIDGGVNPRVKEYVSLFDEWREIAGVGLISMNLVEQIVLGITEMLYQDFFVAYPVDYLYNIQC